MIFLELRQMFKTKEKIDLVTIVDKCRLASVDKCFEGGEKEMVIYLMELLEYLPEPFELIKYRKIVLNYKKGGDAL